MKYWLRFLGVGIFLLSMAKSSVSQQLFFEQITGKNHSPNTPIHGIAKDSIGYIWFGSWNGVYRYDGNTFDLYRHNAGVSCSLPNNRIRNIITDQNQSLWLLTFDKKYVKYNYSQNHFEAIPDSLIPGVVVSMLNSSSNQLNRNLRIHDKRYLLSSHHLTELNIRTKESRQYLANYDQPGGLLDDYITSFYIDDQQIIWIGTRSGDIYKANTKRKPFEQHYCYEKDNENVKKMSARALLRINDELWIGTNNNGIVINDRDGKPKNHPLVQSISEQSQIRALLKDKKGNVWIGGVSGLECFQPELNKSIIVIDRNTHPELTVWSVYAIKVDQKNNLWVGLYNGLARINLANNDIHFFDFHELIGDRSVMDILEDKKHRLWLATEGSGIIRMAFDVNGNTIDTLVVNSINVDITHRITGDMVYALYEDCWGNIWAGTTDGLNCIDANTAHVQHFTDNNGLPDIYISAVTGDNDGNIWVSHKKGISKLVRGSNTVLNYSITDKNSNWTFLDGACYNDTVNQSIYFGAREGYVLFNPAMIKSGSFHPTLVLKNLFISDNEVAPMELIKGNLVLSKVLSQTKIINLDYSNRNFAIEMAALHYESATDNQFVYQLEGYDEDWKKTSLNKVAYTKISPGKYIFKAKALSPDNLSSNEVQLIVYIHAPWFASNWAIAVYILVVLFILYVIYREVLLRERLKNQVLIERLKVEKQEELNREKLEFFTNVSHELRTPLTLIIDPLKQIQNKKLSSNNRNLYLSIINRNIEHLTKLINQLLDFRKAEAGKLIPKLTVCDVVNEIKAGVDAFKMNARQRDIDLSFHTEINQIQGYFDKEKMQQILMNLMSNAFKYTPNGGKIAVVIKQDREASTLQVVVEDNGIGIERKSLKRIFEPFNNEGSQPFYGNSSGMGLALTRHLVNILNGEITIESLPKKGTKVGLSLPFERVEGVDEKFLKVSGNDLDVDLRLGIELLPDKEESKPTVLIVEDNTDVQDYLAAELNDHFLILQEYNGRDGLVRAREYIPDLIISDVMMPEMDGNELCKTIKTNETTCHIPFILLTAKASEENQIEGLQTGADVYVTKPFNIEVLKAQIDSIIENRIRLQHKLAQKTHINELEHETHSIDHVFIQKIVQLVKANLDEFSFGTEQLAALLEISLRQLYRKLKAISGSTVHEFITRVRMDEAVNLLVNSNMNVSQIAYQVGYSEPSNFSRTFTRHFGCSPTQYVKNKAKN